MRKYQESTKHLSATADKLWSQHDHQGVQGNPQGCRVIFVLQQPIWTPAEAQIDPAGTAANQAKVATPEENYEEGTNAGEARADVRGDVGAYDLYMGKITGNQWPICCPVHYTKVWEL